MHLTERFETHNRFAALAENKREARSPLDIDTAPKCIEAEMSRTRAETMEVQVPSAEPEPEQDITQGQ